MRGISCYRSVLIVLLSAAAFGSSASADAPSYSGSLYGVVGSPTTLTINYSLVPDGKGKFSLDFANASAASDAQLNIKSSANFGFVPESGDLTLYFALGSSNAQTSLPINGLEFDKNQFSAKSKQLNPFAIQLIRSIDAQQRGFDLDHPVPAPSLATLTLVPKFGGNLKAVSSPVDGYVQILFQNVTPKPVPAVGLAALVAIAQGQDIVAQGQNVVAQGHAIVGDGQGVVAQGAAVKALALGPKGNDDLVAAALQVASAELQVAISELEVALAAGQVASAQQPVALAALPVVLPGQIAEALKQQSITAQQQAATAKLQKAAAKLQAVTVRAQKP